MPKKQKHALAAFDPCSDGVTSETSLVPAAGDDPISVTRGIISEMAAIPGAMMENWAAELRQIALAAAAHSEFKPAVEAYQSLGKHFGTLTDAPQAAHQHVHLHNLREAPTEDIEGRLAALKQQAQGPDEAGSNTPTDDIDMEYL